jgi:hypothetical protein
MDPQSRSGRCWEEKNFALSGTEPLPSSLYPITAPTKLIFFNWYSGGWSPIVSTRHCGHQLCQPQVIMMMEKLVQ